MFADVPTQTTLLGGVVISAATLWVARREHHRPIEMPEPADTEALAEPASKS
jgi:hypothetical protein